MWRQARRILALSLLMAALTLLAACGSTESQGEVSTVTAGDSAATTTQLKASAGLPADQASPPTRLSIPAVDLDWPVTAMGWIITQSNGDRTTRWVVPADEVGWHVNSVGAGAMGTMLLSGHQGVGSAVFAPLALGDIRADQEVLITDEEGRIFVYQIVEVSDPIPVNGANEAEIAAAEVFTTSSDDAQLTLITGWPDFTTTHRIFARALLQGQQ